MTKKGPTVHNIALVLFHRPYTNIFQASCTCVLQPAPSPIDCSAMAVWWWQLLQQMLCICCE